MRYCERCSKVLLLLLKFHYWMRYCERCFIVTIEVSMFWDIERWSNCYYWSFITGWDIVRMRYCECSKVLLLLLKFHYWMRYCERCSKVLLLLLKFHYWMRYCERCSIFIVYYWSFIYWMRYCERCSNVLLLLLKFHYWMRYWEVFVMVSNVNIEVSLLDEILRGVLKFYCYYWSFITGWDIVRGVLKIYCYYCCLRNFISGWDIMRGVLKFYCYYWIEVSLLDEILWEVF